ncbi:hypothetical protein C1645_825767 [Glomus cerebriforme]|uniref:Uncharacterized protein n=1 Tax=Glomus cerebriforme TaxID=658196 RepID=A0A397SV54_9GLOM|nr:hypothetical protein C1645_825767 [Glomus cerebriforme]
MDAPIVDLDPTENKSNSNNSSSSKRRLLLYKYFTFKIQNGIAIITKSNLNLYRLA